MARRKRIWVRRSFLIGPVADLINPSFLVHPGVTVARTRLGLYPTAGTVANGSTVLGTIVRDSASTGITGPVTNPQADWMSYNLVQSDAQKFLQPQQIDVKSMRKMDELDSRLFLFAEFPVSATDIVVIGVQSSVLLLLP